MSEYALCQKNPAHSWSKPVPPKVREALSSEQGKPLDPATRQMMESQLGHDFGIVRIHDNRRAAESARDVNAMAYTIGHEIVFGSGQYSPSTREGQQLIAHELGHVVQQRKTGPMLERANKGVPIRMANVYQYTVDGKTVNLTQNEYNRERDKAIHSMEADFKRIEDTAQIWAKTHKNFLDNIHGFFGVVSDIVADTVPPSVGIWSWPKPAIANGRMALKFGNLSGAAKQLKLAQDALHDSQKEWNSYIDKTTGGAQKAVTFLEYTRDISFGIAIGTAAIVAAPVVAAGAAGVTGSAGLTGTLATGATALGTGVTVTAGGAGTGALLYGGSSAVGQALTVGKVNLGEVKREVKKGAKAGAVAAFSSVTGLGAARALGPGASLTGTVLRGTTAGSVSGAAGSTLEATLEGKSAKEIAAAGGKGLLTGAVGGAFGSAGKSTTGRLLAGGAAGAGAGAVGAILAGGSAEDAKKAALIAGISGLVSASATPSEPAVGTSSKTQLKQLAAEFKSMAPTEVGKITMRPAASTTMSQATPTVVEQSSSTATPSMAMAKVSQIGMPDWFEPTAHQPVPEVTRMAPEGFETSIISNKGGTPSEYFYETPKGFEPTINLPAGPVKSRAPPGFQPTYIGTGKRFTPGTLEGFEPTSFSSIGRPRQRVVTSEEQLYGIPSPESWGRIRGLTPTPEIRARAQADLPVGSSDPAFPTLTVTGTAQADHIVSVDQIRQMPGFAQLSEQNQLRVLNMGENFVALSPIANPSKGSKSYEQWTRHEELGLFVDETFRQTMTSKEKALQPVIQNRINELLQTQISGK